MTGNLKRLRPYDQPPKPRPQLIPSGPDAAAMGYFGFGALWLLTATGIGSLAAVQMVISGFQLVVEELPFGLAIAFTPETVAAGFRHTFVWGWLTNAALGAIFFITPRLTGRPLARPRMGLLGMITWNIGFAAGLTALYLPALAGTGTLTAFPLPVNLVLLLGLLLINGSFWNSLRGRFLLEDGEAAHLFVEQDSPPYVKVRTTRYVVWINFRDRVRTRDLYAMLVPLTVG